MKIEQLGRAGEGEWVTILNWEVGVGLLGEDI